MPDLFQDLKNGTIKSSSGPVDTEPVKPDLFKDLAIIRKQPIKKSSGLVAEKFDVSPDISMTFPKLDPVIEKYVDDLPGYKGIKEYGKMLNPFSDAEGVESGNDPMKMTYNDDEKKVLKQMFLRTDIDGKTKQKAMLDMGSGHYYFNDNGLPVPVYTNTVVPKGKNIEGVWGSQQSVDEKTNEFWTPTKSLGKHLLNAIPSVIESVADVAAWTEGITTGSSSEGYKVMKTQLDALKMKTPTSASRAMFNTDGVEEWKDLLDTKRIDVDLNNFTGNVSQGFGSILQYIVGGEIAKGLGMGASASTKLSGILGEAEMSLSQLATRMGTTKAKALGTRILAKTPYIANSLAMQIGEGMDGVKDAGIKGREGYLVAMAYATAASATEVELGFTGRIARGEFKDKSSKIAKNLIKEWHTDANGKITNETLADLFNLTTATKAGFLKTVGNVAGKAIKKAGGEAIEEVAQGAEKNLVGEMYDDIKDDPSLKVGEGKFGTHLISPQSFAGAINDAAGGFFTSLGGDAVNGLILNPRSSLRKIKEEEKSKNVYNAISSGKADELRAELAGAEKRGGLSKEDYDLAIQRVNGYEEYHNQVDGLELTHDKKRRISDLTWSNENIKTQIETLSTDPKSKVPDTIPFNRIKELKSQLSNNSAEVTKLIKQPIADQQSATATKTQEDIDKENEPETKPKPITPPKTFTSKAPIDTEPAEPVEPPKEVGGIKVGDKVMVKHDGVEQEVIVSGLNENIKTDKGPATLNSIDYEIPSEDGKSSVKGNTRLFEPVKKVDAPRDLRVLGKSTPAKTSEAQDEHNYNTAQLGSKIRLNEDKIKKIKEELGASTVNIDEDIPSTDLADNSDFMKEQLKKVNVTLPNGSVIKKDSNETFSDLIATHKSIVENNKFGDREPTMAQEEAIKSLQGSGILSSKEGLGSTQVENSHTITKAVRRLQWMKVKAKSEKNNEQVKAIDKYLKDTLDLLSTAGKQSDMRTTHELLTNKVGAKPDEHLKNLQDTSRSLADKIENLGEVINRTKLESKKRSMEKKVKRLDEHLKQIENAIDLHNEQNPIVVTKKSQTKTTKNKTTKTKKVKTQEYIPTEQSDEANDTHVPLRPLKKVITDAKKEFKKDGKVSDETLMRIAEGNRWRANNGRNARTAEKIKEAFFKELNDFIELMKTDEAKAIEMIKNRKVDLSSSPEYDQENQDYKNDFAKLYEIIKGKKFNPSPVTAKTKFIKAKKNKSVSEMTDEEILKSKEFSTFKAKQDPGLTDEIILEYYKKCK